MNPETKQKWIEAMRIFKNANYHRKTQFLYESDFKDDSDLIKKAQELHDAGVRVFIQGYNAMDCKEYKPR